MEAIGQELAVALAPEGRLEDEMQAMQWIVDGFEPLDRAARQRVLDWANDRFKRDGFPERSVIDLLGAFLEVVATWRDSLVEPTEQDQKLIDAILKNTKYDPAVAAKQGARK